MDLSDSEISESDSELQTAFAEGRLKPGLNIPQKAPKTYTNNPIGLKQKLTEFKSKLSWLELLDCVTEQAPLAPELAAQMLIQESKRENQLKNNKKLTQFKPNEDPVLNDFKRESLFHRQAQAAVLECLPKLNQLGIPLKRPDDYFAEMVKTDDQMQKIREHLMQKQQQQKQSERVKELREQRKHGKQIQIQAKLERQKDKKKILDQVKKIRKDKSKDLSFLDGNKTNSKMSGKRKLRDKKFGFGGRKKGSKYNTKDSAADISEYRKPGGKSNKKFAKGGNKRLGKNRRIKNNSKKRK